MVPSSSKNGMPHLIVSVVSGTARCTNSRRWFAMGCTAGDAAAIFPSTRASNRLTEVWRLEPVGVRPELANGAGGMVAAV